MKLSRIILKPGREKSLLRRHPWVFTGAIERIEGSPQSGDTVTVVSGTGQFLAYAGYSPHSQIAARAWSFLEDECIDTVFFRKRLQRAIFLRTGLPDLPDPIAANAALRLVHGESDGLPGLVCDRYGGVLVVQYLAAGAEKWRETTTALLSELTGCKNVFERSDADVRELEGLPVRIGVALGAAPAGPVEIEEHGLRFLVDVAQGHKTGFYLDQRENRRIVGKLAGGGEMLNCFCYTGGFSLSALKCGAAKVLSIDSSGPALAIAKKQVELNRLDRAKMEWMEADVFTALRDLRNRGRSFDVVVLDPPKFAPTAAHAEKASRAYKDINLLGLKLLKPGGVLATFSCSGGISADLFQKIIAGAALDAGMDASIMMRLGAAPDHPVALHFPEGAYLKGLLVKRAA